MHIPDGYLSPQTAGGLWAMMVPAWYWAGYRVRKSLSTKQAPLVAIGAAFTFVVMMFNIPLPGGTSGHAVGGTLIAIVIGPWAAVVAITVALVIQAVFFGDGGILAIGANCFNIGFILPVAGYYTYRLIAGRSPQGSTRRVAAAGIGSFVGLNLAALLTAVEFGLQGDLFTAADGSALYSPYGLSTAIPAMMIPHLLVVGLVEGVMTSLIYVFLHRTNAALLDNYAGARMANSAGYRLKPLIIGLVLLLVFAPLGLLAGGTAWGEWSREEIGSRLGYVPSGMEKYSGYWEGVLPDYGLPEGDEASQTGASAQPVAALATGEPAEPVQEAGEAAPAYLISGVLGLMLAGGVVLMAVRMLTVRSRNNGHPG